MLLVDPSLSTEDKQRLSQAIDASRRALDRYEELRSRGENRVYVFAGISNASAAIVADDVTGVGAADNFLLIAAGLGVIATYILTDAAASSDELALEYVGDPCALDALEAALDDDADPVRSYVAIAIERLGGASRLPVIQRRLAIEMHPQPRADLIAAALRFGDESAFDPLLSLAAEVDCENFVYHVLRVVDELLDGSTPDMVLRRAAELEPHLTDLPRRAGRLAEWAGNVRAKLVAKAGLTDDEK